MSKNVGRPKVKDRKVAVTFTALSSKVKEANKKGKKERNEYLRHALYEFIEH